MSRIKWRHLFLFLCIVLAGVSVYNLAAQSIDKLKWKKEIEGIEKRYNGRYPADVVVFTGSSSIRGWKTLAADMAPVAVVNHGFGGARVSDVTLYADRIITPFKPKAIVLFAGSNDISGIPGETEPAEQVYQEVAAFYAKVHLQNPGVPIYFISITPTEKRWKVWPEVQEANSRIQALCREHDDLTFIDISRDMLDDQGKPNRLLFKSDQLHPNQRGYEVWTSKIKPVLLRNLYGIGAEVK